jgi:hypothetical protein
MYDGMTLFAIDVPRMFANGDDRKYIKGLTLRAQPRFRPMIWIHHCITILSGR